MRLRLENDQTLNELYQEEFNKIPVLFRFSRKRGIIALVLIGVFALAACFSWSLFYSTAAYQTQSSFLPGYQMGVNSYDYAYLIACIVFALIVVIISGWLVISGLLEKRAFAKASKLANMIFLSERHREAIKHQNETMLRRD